MASLESIIMAAVRHLTPHTRCAVSRRPNRLECGYRRDDLGSHIDKAGAAHATQRYAAITWADGTHLIVHSGTGYTRESAIALIESEIAKRGLPKGMAGTNDVVYLPAEATPVDVPLCKACGARGIDISGKSEKWLITCAGCAGPIDIAQSTQTTDRLIHRELRRVSGGFFVPVWCEDEQGCGGVGLAALAGVRHISTQGVRVLDHACWRRQHFLAALQMLPSWQGVTPSESYYSAWSRDGMSMRKTLRTLVLGIVLLADWQARQSPTTEPTEPTPAKLHTTREQRREAFQKWLATRLDPVAPLAPEPPEVREARRAVEVAELRTIRPDWRRKGLAHA